MFIGNRGIVSKVCECLSALWSTEQNGVGTGWTPQCQLVKGQNLTSSGQNTCLGAFGERQCADGHFRTFKHTNIVGDFSNDDSNLSVLVGHVFGKTVEANWWLVDFGHVEAFDDRGAECGSGTTFEEFVEFD